MPAASFKESEVKKTIRLLLRDAAALLQRPEITYLGMPAERALDVLALKDFLKNTICIAEKQTILDEALLSTASLSLKERRFEIGDVWDYLRDRYPKEPLVSDLTFLDFYGGGIRKEDPFASEVAGLRSYFAKHAHHANKAYVLAWTYMPRDKGRQIYIDTLKTMVAPEVFALLNKTTSGMNLRSLAIRMLIRQSLVEHNMQVRVVQHAVYKNTMNALIIIYSKGLDPKCNKDFNHADSLLYAPCYVYSAGEYTPKVVRLLSR